MNDRQRRIARARLLRREGKTYDEIRAVIGPVDDKTLQVCARHSAARLDLPQPSHERGALYRLNIHENADVPAHERWWADRLQVPLANFGRATLKRHKPTTVRLNTDEHYHGCLVVSVRRSSNLYDCIEGWWSALIAVSHTSA